MRIDTDAGDLFKWQSAKCVWAQFVSLYASAPMSEFPLGLSSGRGHLPPFGLMLPQLWLFHSNVELVLLDVKVEAILLPICPLKMHAVHIDRFEAVFSNPQYLDHLVF